MQGVTAVIAESKGVLAVTPHRLITDGTVIVWAWLALVRVCGGSRGESFPCPECMNFANTRMSDGVWG